MFCSLPKRTNQHSLNQTLFPTNKSAGGVIYLFFGEEKQGHYNGVHRHATFNLHYFLVATQNYGIIYRFSTYNDYIYERFICLALMAEYGHLDIS